MLFKLRVEDAQRQAINEMKKLHEDRDRGKKGSVLKGRRPKGGKRDREEMDREEG